MGNNPTPKPELLNLPSQINWFKHEKNSTRTENWLQTSSQPIDIETTSHQQKLAGLYQSVKLRSPNTIDQFILKLGRHLGQNKFDRWLMDLGLPVEGEQDPLNEIFSIIENYQADPNNQNRNLLHSLISIANSVAQNPKLVETFGYLLAYPNDGQFGILAAYTWPQSLRAGQFGEFDWSLEPQKAVKKLIHQQNYQAIHGILESLSPEEITSWIRFIADPETGVLSSLGNIDSQHQILTHVFDLVNQSWLSFYPEQETFTVDSLQNTLKKDETKGFD